jgi:hypothetical protein
LVVSEAARTGVCEKPDRAVAPVQRTGGFSYAGWRTEVLGLAAIES